MIKKKTKFTKSYLLIDLLASFSTQELERLEHFVTSTFFNTDQWVIKLFKALQKEVIGQQAFSEAMQVIVYRTVFSNLPASTSLLNQRQKKLLGAKMSALTQLAKRFLVHENLETYPAYQTTILHQQLLAKNQFRLITKLHKKTQQDLEKETRKGIEYYELAWQEAANQLAYLHQTGVLTKEDNFPALISNLDMYYLLNKLKIHTAMLSLKNVIQKKYDFTSMETIKPLLELAPYNKHPLLIVYRTIFQLMETKEEAVYKHLLSLLEQYYPNIPKSYLVDFYYVANNYCIHQIREGKSYYNQNVFDLYKTMDQKGLLVEGSFMQPVTLKNLVAVACRVQAFEWATAIIDKYRPYIKKEVQESVYHFNLGIIAFYQHQYQTAISHLIRVDKVNLAYNLDSRLLLLQAYYELDRDYDERTMQIFRSTEHFIKVHKDLPTTHKRSYKNFIQVLINLYRVRHGVGKRTLEGVSAKLSKMESVMARQWLLEKIKEVGIS